MQRLRKTANKIYEDKPNEEKDKPNEVYMDGKKLEVAPNYKNRFVDYYRKTHPKIRDALQLILENSNGDYRDEVVYKVLRRYIKSSDGKAQIQSEIDTLNNEKFKTYKHNVVSSEFGNTNRHRRAKEFINSYVNKNPELLEFDPDEEGKFTDDQLYEILQIKIKYE